MESFSRKLCHLLDHLGYNSEMIKIRRDAFKVFGKNIDRDIVSGIITGSKSEGISLLFESDLDLMILVNSVQCIHTTEQLPSQLPNGETTVFLADMENMPSGYTRLKLHQPASCRNVTIEYVRDCLLESQGDFYLSSTEFTANTKKLNLQLTPGCMARDISGPALQSTIFNEIDIDLVLGFTFHCPQLLQIWASRRRQNEWPSEDTIRTACSFLPQVVPVGAKGSDRQDQEWRFCFIKSELTLTISLNDTQIKLYILMKMIAKNILKPVTSEISSYMMKNLIYWLSELLPSSVFREEKLASLVLLALNVFRTAVTRWKNLPYYMIPSRNLLSERLDSNTRSELSDLLNRLIQEGPRLFLRIEKLREYLETPCPLPDYIVHVRNVRDQFEKLMLTYIVKFDMLTKNPFLFFFTEGWFSLISSIKQLPLQLHNDLFVGDDTQQVFFRMAS